MYHVIKVTRISLTFIDPVPFLDSSLLYIW